MTAITESDIQVLKDLINHRFDELTTDIKEVKTEISQLKAEVSELKAEGIKRSEQIKNLEIGQAEIKGRLTSLENNSNKIPDLAEKVGELKNWKQIGLTLIGTVIGGVVTYLARNSHP